MTKFPYDYTEPQPQPPALPEGAGFAVIQAKQNNKQFAKWHPTLEAAQAEARRLAAANNQPFAVIQLIGVMEPEERPVNWRPAQ
jgi:hypothetical protein